MYWSVCVGLVEILNVLVKPQKLGLSGDTIEIINDCLLHRKMEDIKIKLAFKSIF
jgi:hypothetical protein